MTKVFKKGTVYYNYTELGPVLDALVIERSLTTRFKPWGMGHGGSTLTGIGVFECELPITLTRDIPIPQPEQPRPLTVEEIKNSKFAWYINRYDKELTIQAGHSLALKGALVTFNIPCYATEDDCRRAHEMEVG